MTDKAALTVAEALQRIRRRDRLFERPTALPTSPEQREGLILEVAGDLLALRVADAEWVRRAFGLQFGRGELGPQSSEELDLSRAHDGVVGVTLTLTSARDWDRLRSQGFVTGDHRAGTRGVFRDRGLKRARWRKPETIVRAVAVHYLSRTGGGTRDAEDAAGLYAEHLEADDKWDASSHARIIRQVETEYGPLP